MATAIFDLFKVIHPIYIQKLNERYIVENGQVKMRIYVYDWCHIKMKQDDGLWIIYCNPSKRLMLKKNRRRHLEDVKGTKYEVQTCFLIDMFLQHLTEYMQNGNNFPYDNN